MLEGKRSLKAEIQVQFGDILCSCLVGGGENPVMAYGWAWELDDLLSTSELGE